MHLPRFHLALLLALAFILHPSSLILSAPAERPPNILLILCDDLGYSDLGCYGGEIRTPHLDRLASEGMRFTQFYNGAVCVMTRAALTTGLYPRHGKGGLLRPDMVTLGEVMREAGYATGLIGKWHLGSEAPKHPIDRGFDEYYGLLDGCCNFFNPAKPDPMFYNGGKIRAFARNRERITEFPDDYYTTNAFTDEAVAFIKSKIKNQKSAIGNQDSPPPFFLHLCYTAPHYPLHAPPEDIARYRGKYADGYDALRTRRHQRQIAMGLFDESVALSPIDPKTSDHRQDFEVTPWDQLDDATRAREEQRMEVYAAMVDRLDQGIGRVLDALEESGAAENTIVLFLSDNGGCASWPNSNPEKFAGFLEYNEGIPVGDARGYELVGPGWGWAQNAPFRRHKTWTYEGGIATPMIARWPGVVTEGKITRQPGHVVDFMPTLLALAGGVYPDTRDGHPIPPMEGESLLPIFRGETRKRSEPLCWALYGNRAVRQGDWKLVWGGGDRRWELYDLSVDRSETNDIAKQNPERVAEMTAYWERWAEMTEVK